MINIWTYLKGMAMGAADVVPGVSGGTIAFITGIYDTLLESIRRVNPSLLNRIKSHGLRSAFEYINGPFLITLFAGILTSIISLAKLISWLLMHHPVPLWSFFFGLILVSVYHMLKQVQGFSWRNLSMLVMGAVLAYVITDIKPLVLEFSALNVFIAGSIAICAMILPGISGSFILLLLGLYEPVLRAVKQLEWTTLGLFAAGCVVGLLSFSHVLGFLLARFRAATLLFLTGLMIGTLPKIWPWKETISYRTNSKGESVPFLQNNISPFEFEQLYSQPSHLLLSLCLMTLAIGLVLGLEKVADNSNN